MQARSGDSCESSAVGGVRSRLGGFTNWPIEKGGRGVQEGGWAGSCNMDNRKKDNIDSKKVDASEIISELVGGI